MARFVEKLHEVRAVIAFMQAGKEGRALPPLYATLKLDYPARDRNGAVKQVHAGERVRVTYFGKFGDLGVTTNLADDDHHEVRFTLAEMCDYSDKP